MVGWFIILFEQLNCLTTDNRPVTQLVAVGVLSAWCQGGAGINLSPSTLSVFLLFPIFHY